MAGSNILLDGNILLDSWQRLWREEVAVTCGQLLAADIGGPGRKAFGEGALGPWLRPIALWLLCACVWDQFLATNLFTLLRSSGEKAAQGRYGEG